MAHYEQYYCDMCGSEILDNEKCWKSISITKPNEYLSSLDYLYNRRLNKLICQSCLPYHETKVQEKRRSFGLLLRTAIGIK